MPGPVQSCTPDCILTALDLLFVVPKNTLLRAEHDFFSLQLFRDVQQAAAQDGLVRRLLALVSFSDTKDPGMVRQAREDYDRLLAALDPDAGAARPVPPGTMWKSLVKQGLRPFGEILSGSYDCDQHGAWAVPQGAVDFVPMTDLAPEEGENIDITIALSKWFDIGRPTPKEAKALPVCPRCEQPPARRNRLWHRDVPSILFFEFPLDVPSGGDSTPTNISVQYFSKEYGLQRAVYSWLFTIGGVDVMGQRPDEVNNYVLYHAVTHSPNQILQYDVSNTTYGGETPLTIVQCEGDVENRVPKGCRKALVALERRPTRPGQLSYSDWLYRMENAADVEPYTESRVRMLPRESSGGELPGDDVPVTLS